MTNPKLYQEAESFIKEEFWKNTHDPSSKLHIPKLVEQQLIADNKNKDVDYFGHREGVVHSTSLAKCLRGVVHEMLGAKKDNELEPRKLGIFKAGNLFEEFIVSALGDRVVHKQREYEYKYKSITLVGRSDYTINDDGIFRIGENKSVHSDSFWMREREGTLIAWHNQVQLMTYLWLERMLDPYRCIVCQKIVLSNLVPECTCAGAKTGEGKMVPAPEQKLVNPQGVFSYISKDDCTVIGTSVKFNQHIIDEVIIPALDIINEGHTTKNPVAAPLPPIVIFSEAKHQFQKNWIARYCEYHSTCAGAGWILEATNLVTSKNKELKAAMGNPHAKKKVKPTIKIVE